VTASAAAQRSLKDDVTILLRFGQARLPSADHLNGSGIWFGKNRRPQQRAQLETGSILISINAKM
jgi:hypothetical protein